MGLICIVRRVSQTDYKADATKMGNFNRFDINNRVIIEEELSVTEKVRRISETRHSFACRSSYLTCMKITQTSH